MAWHYGAATRAVRRAQDDATGRAGAERRGEHLGCAWSAWGHRELRVPCVRAQVKGRVGQALWHTAAVAAAGTALARRAARRGDGTIGQLGGSGLTLRGWRGAACCITREARERIPAFARLASRVLWLCSCCVHAWGRAEGGGAWLGVLARGLVCLCVFAEEKGEHGKALGVRACMSCVCCLS